MAMRDRVAFEGASKTHGGLTEAHSVSLSLNLSLSVSVVITLKSSYCHCNAPICPSEHPLHLHLPLPPIAPWTPVSHACLIPFSELDLKGFVQLAGEGIGGGGRGALVRAAL